MFEVAPSVSVVFNFPTVGNGQESFPPMSSFNVTLWPESSESIVSNGVLMTLVKLE